MQFLKELLDLKAKAIEDYYQLARDSEKYYWKEYNAALKIQTCFRRYHDYKKYTHLKRMVIKIQRRFRIYVAKITTKKKRFVDNQLKLMAYFSSQAVVIQRCFRGYYCRKYVHDFYARAAYMKFLEAKNEEIRKNMDDYYHQTVSEEEKRREENAKNEFKELAKNLHHLSSTRAIPGVYNPPFLAEGTKPSAFGVEVESHLKNTFKENYQWKAPDKKTIDTYKRKLKPISAK